MTTTKDKIICSCCGEEKNLTREFYTTFDHFHKSTGRLHICKKCIFDYVGDEPDINKFQNFLRSIDKPYIEHLWKSAIQVKSFVGEYFKLINAKDFRYMTWNDSDFEGHKQIIEEINISPIYEINDEIISYWGSGYDDWEYDFLENERVKLMTSFECPDYGMEMIMKDICFINLDIEKIRQERNTTNQKAITTLIETRSKLMNNANMNPIQATGAEGNDQVTFGTLIKKWENERPVPKPLDDEMKEYIDTFMIGHLAKMEGLNNEMTEKYDEALSKYTIDFNEINKNEEEYDD